MVQVKEGLEEDIKEDVKEEGEKEGGASATAANTKQAGGKQSLSQCRGVGYELASASGGHGDGE